MTTRRFLSILLLGLGATAQITFNTTLPDLNFTGTLSGVSAKCAAAYASLITCPDLLLKLRSATAGPPLFTLENLQSLCSADCINSLNTWDKAVNKECSSDADLMILEDPTGKVPAYFRLALRGRHEVQEHLYWPFCLKDQTTKDFCLLKPGLPAWTADPAVLCNDRCRLEQSYLIHSAAGGHEIKAFDATAKCPMLDPTAFEMNAVSFDAFGVAVVDKVVELPGVDGLLMDGTEYQVEKMFDTQLVSVTGSGDGGAAAAAAVNATAAVPGGDTSGVARVKVCTAAVAAAGLLVVMAL